MPSLIDIRRRVRAVKSTQQITKAMKMVSASKLRRAQERIVNARPFAQKMLRVLNSLAARVDPSAHPLLARSRATGGRPHAAHRHHRRQGPGGSFNTNVIKAASQFVNENAGRQVAIGLVGRKGRDFFRRRGFDVRYEDVGLFSVAQALARAGDRARAPSRSSPPAACRSVYLVYNEFKSVMTQRVVIERLLPIAQPRAATSRPAPQVDYIYEPSPEAILGELLPKHVEMPDLPRPARIGGRRARGAHDGDGRGDAQRQRHDRRA